MAATSRTGNDGRMTAGANRHPDPHQAVAAYLDRIIGEGVVGAIGLVEAGEAGEGGDESGGVTCAAAGSMALGGPPMGTDAIVRIQSMTKAITAVAALRLVEAGRLALDDPIDRWLPELADPRVLRTPVSDLGDTVPAVRPITVRHLLTLTCGHGMGEGTPYDRAQADAGVAAGPEPVSAGADAWLARLATLPLAHQPGEGWRYHHGFMLLGILLGRLTARPLGEHLADDVFGPLGMVDTGLWARDPGRLPAAHRLEPGGPVEVEPAGAGHYAGDPGIAIDHGELVSTAADYLRFARMLRDGGLVEGRPYLTAGTVAELRRDQVPERAKTPDSFGPGFWRDTGWGYGVAVEHGGHAGRFGWSGGLGTDFSVDPTTGRITILLTQVEMSAATVASVLGFRDVLSW